MEGRIEDKKKERFRRRKLSEEGQEHVEGRRIELERMREGVEGMKEGKATRRIRKKERREDNINVGKG